MPTIITRTVPKNSLAFLFPSLGARPEARGFNEFWQQTGIKTSLEQVIYYYVPGTMEREEIKKTIAQI